MTLTAHSHSESEVHRLNGQSSEVMVQEYYQPAWKQGKFGMTIKMYSACVWS